MSALAIRPHPAAPRPEEEALPANFDGLAITPSSTDAAGASDAHSDEFAPPVGVCCQCRYTPLVSPDADAGGASDSSAGSSSSSSGSSLLCPSCRHWSISCELGPSFPAGCRGMVARVDLDTDQLIFEDQLVLAAPIPSDAKEEQAPTATSHQDTSTTAAAYVGLLRSLLSYTHEPNVWLYWIRQVCAIDPDDFRSTNTADGSITGANLLLAAKRLAEADGVAAAAAGSAALPESAYTHGMIQIKLNSWRLASGSALGLPLGGVHGDEDLAQMILPLQVASINHSCVPNAILLNGCQLFAARPIAAGEQIFVSYLPPATLLATPDVRERRRLLKRTWGFECACPRCQVDDAAQAAATSPTGVPDASIAQRQQQLRAWSEQLEEAWIFHGFHPEYEAVYEDDEAGEGEEEAAAGQEAGKEEDAPPEDEEANVYEQSLSSK